MRRKWLIALALSTLSMQANAQDAYPSRPVSIVVPYSAGGSSDVAARILAAELAKTLKQQFYVENRTGAGGNIATQYVVNAKPDGYTLLLATGAPITIVPALYEKLPFNVAKDLTPVVLTTTTAYVLMASSKFPANSVQELVALAKANPGKFNFASSGVGSDNHLAAERLNIAAGTKIVHVPYKGVNPAVADIIEGRVHVVFGSLTLASSLVKTGNLKALAVTSARRHPALPDVPTMIEAGFPGFEISTWFGLMAPAGTPPAVVETLRSAAVNALQSKDVADRYSAQNMDLVGQGPRELAERISAETKMWSEIVKTAGIKPE